MDFRQLSYFVAVAEERHLGRAAERLHLSQPPLTRHIKALESDLGVQLFIRTPRGMLLTEAGETLLKDAQAILGMLRSAADRAQRSGSGQTGRLDIGLYGSATFGVVPEVLMRFKVTHPDVDVVLHYAQTPAQVPALRQGRVVIVFERLLPKEPGIEVQLVAREPLVLALSDHHRLAKRKVVDIASLKHETIRVGTAPAEAATAVELCRRHGFEPHFAPVASDVIMATLHASTGPEVALVPWSMTHVKFPGVTYVPLKTRAPAFMDLHCFYLREQRSPLIDAMLETVVAYRNEAKRAARNQPR
jgi:DNA-binding transcriptional LysR family regulator